MSQKRAAASNNKRKSKLSAKEKERRQDAYREFVSTVPRKCPSPDPFGLANCKPGPSESAEESGLEMDLEFNWSIEQIARLNPTEFSEDEQDIYDEVDRKREGELNRSCDEFFAQSAILESPPKSDGEDQTDQMASMESGFLNMSTNELDIEGDGQLDIENASAQIVSTPVKFVRNLRMTMDISPI